MLSFKLVNKESKPIAIIKSVKKDPLNNQIIYYTDGNEDLLKSTEKSHLNTFKKVFNSNQKLELPLKGKAVIEVIPDIRTKDRVGRVVYYCSGISGAGKSYFIANILKNYNKMEKNNEIYIFTDNSNTKAYDDTKLDINYIDISNYEGDEMLTLNDFIDGNNGCIVVFDDYQNNDYANNIRKTRNELLENGRAHKISVVDCSHLFSDGQHSRKPLNEANYYVVYPKYTRKIQVQEGLIKKLGMSKKDVDEILKVPSRWVCVSTSSPFYIGEKTIKVLDD